ncbi:MAG TPA: hypothetical protein VER12_01595 [Polyangiaceae bacterium]|nr:hypothetical protein [Polyangiaceae bacterium]
MNVALTIVRGGDAAIVENAGDYVVVRSSVASPPGSTLSLKHGELAVQVKVRGCKRLAESQLPFRIEGRLVSFTRAAREALFGIASGD